MRLSNEQIQELKQDLLNMKKELASREEDFDEPANSGELSSMDNHLADSAHGVVDREEDMAEKSLRDKRMREVEEALERIENGTYGKCVDSGEEIPYERLKAVPYAKRTVEAEKTYAGQQRTEGADERGPTSRMEQPEGETEDERTRTMRRMEEEHNQRETPGHVEEENKW